MYLAATCVSAAAAPEERKNEGMFKPVMEGMFKPGVEGMFKPVVEGMFI